jgi:hypothetical protein
VIATEPVTKTTLRTPAAAEHQARGQKARDRYIEIAAALKAEAGVRQHTEHKKMNGHAWMDTGHILAPAGTTRRQLYILAHECGHIALHSTPWTGSKPRHVKEHEAESYAHRALTAHGLEVPEESTYGARWYVAQCIEEDRARGISICPMAEAFATGRRSAYASLAAVDAQRRRQASGPGTIGCGTCRFRSASSSSGSGPIGAAQQLGAVRVRYCPCRKWAHRDIRRSARPSSPRAQSSDAMGAGVRSTWPANGSHSGHIR